MESLQQLVKKIQSVLTPDLLNSYYRHTRPEDAHPVWGHCYVATEVLYHLWGKKAGFKPCYVRIGRGCIVLGNHWFLTNDARTVYVDPTMEQFNEPLPYDIGKRCGFLTRKPSKRARIVMRRIKQL